MIINKKKIVILIVVLIFAWIGNITFYKSQNLKGRLFMKHYYELNSDDALEVYYIENLRSNNNIESITFPEIDAQIPFEIMEVESNKYYKLKKLRVLPGKVSTNDIEGNDVPLQSVLEDKDMLLTKIHINTNNDSNYIVDIGEIYLKSHKKKESSLIFSRQKGGGDSTLRLTEDIKVTNVRSKHMEILQKEANLTISKIPLGEINYPLKVSQEKDLYASYTFKFNKEDIERNYYYNINIDIEGEGVSGEKLETYVNVDNMPSGLYDIDVKSLLKKSSEK